MSSERLDDRALAGELATAAGQLLLQVRSDSGLSGRNSGTRATCAPMTCCCRGWPPTAR